MCCATANQSVPQLPPCVQAVTTSHAFKKGIVTSPVFQYLPKRYGYCSRTMNFRRPIIRPLLHSLELVLSHCANSQDPTIVRHNALGALLTTMKFHKGIVAPVNMCSAIVKCALKVLNLAFNPFVPFLSPSQTATLDAQCPHSLLRTLVHTTPRRIFLSTT